MAIKLSRSQQIMTLIAVENLLQPEVLTLAGMLWMADAWATSAHAGWRPRNTDPNHEAGLKTVARQILKEMDDE
jgi:hypothetical protein